MMNNGFPKMIYRGSGHMVVDNQEQLNTMTAEGWTLNPGGDSTAPEAKNILTIDQVREKVTFYMEKFEKWNGILKEMEGEGMKLPADQQEFLDKVIIPAAEAAGKKLEEDVAKVSTTVAKKPVVKKPARKPAKKAGKKAPEKPAAVPEAAPEG